MASQIEYHNSPDVICLNDAVMLHSNRKGIVRYISDKQKESVAVGIELMEQNDSNCPEVSHLFKCKPGHGILVSLDQISRKIMPEELLIQLQFSSNKVSKYQRKIEDLRSNLMERENRYCSKMTNQFQSRTRYRNQRRVDRGYVSQRVSAAENVSINVEELSFNERPYIVSDPDVDSTDFGASNANRQSQRIRLRQSSRQNKKWAQRRKAVLLGRKLESNIRPKRSTFEQSPRMMMNDCNEENVIRGRQHSITPMSIEHKSNDDINDIVNQMENQNDVDKLQNWLYQNKKE